MSGERGHTLLAFILGGVIGAGVALLLAPDSGAETRRRIREGFDDAEDWARGRYDNTLDRLDKGKDRVRTIMSEKREDIRAAIDAGKDAYLRRKDRLTEES